MAVMSLQAGARRCWTKPVNNPVQFNTAIDSAKCTLFWSNGHHLHCHVDMNMYELALQYECIYANSFNQLWTTLIY